jgi:adenylate kinase family enzyme
MKITIYYEEKYIQKGILVYSHHILNDKTLPLNCISYNDINYSIEVAIDLNNYTVIHNNSAIFISIEYEGDFLAVNHSIERYKKIILEADNYTILDDFIIKSIEYYEVLYIQRIRSDKLNILQYDYMWSLSNYTDKRCIESISLPTTIIDPLLHDIDSFIKNRETILRLNIPYNRIYMLYGPPGTGKTTTIKGIASKYNFNIAMLEVTKDVDDKSLKRACKKLPKNTILVIEDFDCIFDNSRKALDEHRNNISFSGILNILDGINNNDGLILFLTTNHLEKLDTAIKRRIDYFVKFDFATKTAIQHLFNRFYPDKTDKFSEFYTYIKTPVTINILQKYFMKNMNYNIMDKLEELNDYCNAELSLSNIQTNMYT